MSTKYWFDPVNEDIFYNIWCQILYIVCERGSQNLEFLRNEICVGNSNTLLWLSQSIIKYLFNLKLVHKIHTCDFILNIHSSN